MGGLFSFLAFPLPLELELRLLPCQMLMELRLLPCQMLLRCYLLALQLFLGELEVQLLALQIEHRSFILAQQLFLGGMELTLPHFTLTPVLCRHIGLLRHQRLCLKHVLIELSLQSLCKLIRDPEILRRLCTFLIYLCV